MPMIRRGAVWLWAAGLAAASATRAEQDHPQTAANTLLDEYAVRSWGIAEGLPESVVTGIAQGSSGFLWLTTANSLVRFDGASFDVVPAARISATGNRLLLGVLPGCGAGDTRSMFVFGALLVALGPDGGSRNHGATAECLRDVTIRQMVRCGDRLLATSADDVFTWSPGSDWARALWADAEAAREPYRRVCGIDGAGTAWLIDARDRLLQFRDGAAEAIEWPAAVGRASMHGQLNVLVSDQDGVLVVLGRRCFRSRLSAVDASCVRQWIELQPLPEGIQPREHRFVEDRQGNIWVASDRGLHVLRGSAWLTLENTTGAGPADIRTFFMDSAGSVWVGASNGLFRFRPRLFRVVHPESSQRPDRITAVLAAEGETWWLGVAGHPLFHGPAGRLRPLDHPELVRAGTPTALLLARDGTLWCGTSGQHVMRITLAARDGDSPRAEAVTRVTEPPGSAISARNTYGLLEDRDGRVWAATSDGVFLYCPSAGEAASAGAESLGRLIRRPVPGHFVSVSLPRVESIRSLAEATDGAVWLGAETGGPFRVSPAAAIRRFSAADGFPDCHVMSMHPDQDGGMWLATSAGLVHWDGRRFGRVGASHGLPTDSLLQVIGTADGRIWLGTAQGLVVAERDALLQAMRTRYGRVTCRFLTIDDGLDSGACVSGFGNLVTVTEHGEPCFATENGLAVAKRGGDSEPAAPLALPTVVRVAAQPAVDISLQSLPCWPRPLRTAALALPAGARDVRIAFTCPNLESLDGTRFRWRLEGFDPDWSEPTTAREAVYSRLPTGAFRFHVQAWGRGREWVESATPLAVRVQPFFWETRVFPIGVAVVGAVIGGSLLRWNAYRRWQTRLDRERLVHSARERIARDIHDDLGTGLTEIAMAADLAQRDVASDQSTRVAARLGEIYDTAARLARAVDGIVWAVNPANDTLGRFLAYLGQSTGQFLASAGLRSRIEIPDEVPDRPMDSAFRHHLLLATREAVHNIVKHASATLVLLRVSLEGDQVVVVIADDGSGFDAGPSHAGAEAGGNHDGLANMMTRMREIGGSCRVESRPGAGTRVVLEAPLSAGVGA